LDEGRGHPFITEIGERIGILPNKEFLSLLIENKPDSLHFYGWHLQSRHKRGSVAVGPMPTKENVPRLFTINYELESLATRTLA
jgi:hypothetical protein